MNESYGRKELEITGSSLMTDKILIFLNSAARVLHIMALFIVTCKFIEAQRKELCAQHLQSLRVLYFSFFWKQKINVSFLFIRDCDYNCELVIETQIAVRKKKKVMDMTMQ